MKRSLLAVLFTAASALTLSAQGPGFDNSANGALAGKSYYFRHALYAISPQADSQGVAGDINEAVTVYGTISFDGNGNYSITNAQVADSSNLGTNGAPITDPLSCWLANTNCATTAGTPVAGTYGLSPSGYAYIVNPVTGDNIYGLFAANGVFSGSTTELSGQNDAFSDLFVATPLTNQSNATFNGTYTVVGYFPGGSPASSENAFFQLSANGSGSLGTVSITGQTGSGTAISQSNGGINYSFQSGAAVINFPASSTANFISGPVYLYFSPDGNFFVGGTTGGGYDVLIGVRNGSGTQNFSGLYYEAGLDQDLSQVASAGYANFDGYYGSFNATTSGQIVAHDRISSVFNDAPFGVTFGDSFTPPVTGTYTDSSASFQYAVGANGTVRVGAGTYPYLGITMALQAPTFTPPSSAPYINPTGIVNAASFAPFTAGISPGTFIAIYGNNLATGTTVASTLPFPTTLGNMQVIINGVAAPLYYVTPGQIAAIVPGSDPYAQAQVQVVNTATNTSSNIVTVPINLTTPGVYTIPSGGLGYAAAVHTSGQIVTPSNPAAPGETIEAFATGLGTAYPPVADGAAPPTSPLSYTTNTITADVGGTSATVLFAGLAPTLAGLYQINVTVPTTLTSGYYSFDLEGPDSYTSESTLPVGTGPLADARPAATAMTRQARVSKEVAHARSAAKHFCGFRATENCASPLQLPSPGAR